MRCSSSINNGWWCGTRTDAATPAVATAGGDGGGAPARWYRGREHRERAGGLVLKCSGLDWEIAKWALPSIIHFLATLPSLPLPPTSISTIISLCWLTAACYWRWGEGEGGICVRNGDSFSSIHRPVWQNRCATGGVCCCYRELSFSLSLSFSFDHSIDLFLTFPPKPKGFSWVFSSLCTSPSLSLSLSLHQQR